MPDTSAQIAIPHRALFKAAEVCDIVQVQAYVLRSWESEFPDLGVSKTAGAPRVYRRADVEQVARIKHLLLVEGLTLAGARRKLEEEALPVAVDEPGFDALIGQNARERLTAVKRGLRSILDLLTGGNGTIGTTVNNYPAASAKPKAPAVSRKPAPGKPAVRSKGNHSTGARRKRA